MTTTAEPPLDRRHRRIVTPEGVALSVELGERGSRAAAFLLDFVFIVVAVILGAILLFFTAGLLRAWALAIGLLGFFLLRVFYFPFFELHWRGATPGKRILGLKVIDRAGGPLRPEAIVVRNLMREVEVFVPMTLLLAQGQIGMGAVAQLLLVVWIGIFTLMPLFNRDGLRVGDLVAGTLVIATPKTALLPDIAGRAAMTGARRARAAARRFAAGVPDSAALGAIAPGSGAPLYVFTPGQLGVYGAYELQTLESILRRDENAGTPATGGRREIAKRIRAKIGWPDANQFNGEKIDEAAFDPTAFLESFYAAQRAHLERRMLFGHRRKDKHDKM